MYRLWSKVPCSALTVECGSHYALSKGAGDRQLWAQTYEQDLQDVLTLQKAVRS